LERKYSGYDVPHILELIKNNNWVIPKSTYYCVSNEDYNNRVKSIMTRFNVKLGVVKTLLNDFTLSEIEQWEIVFWKLIPKEIIKMYL
jgi:hypothetical protein